MGAADYGLVGAAVVSAAIALFSCLSARRSAKVAEESLAVARTATYQGPLYTKQLGLYGVLLKKTRELQIRAMLLCDTSNPDVASWWNAFAACKSTYADVWRFLTDSLFYFPENVLRKLVEYLGPLAKFTSSIDGKAQAGIPQTTLLRPEDLYENYMALRSTVCGAIGAGPLSEQAQKLLEELGQTEETE